MSKILEYIDKLIAEQEHIVNNCLGINVQLAIAKLDVLKQVREKVLENSECKHEIVYNSGKGGRFCMQCDLVLENDHC